MCSLKDSIGTDASMGFAVPLSKINSYGIAVYCVVPYIFLAHKHIILGLVSTKVHMKIRTSTKYGDNWLNAFDVLSVEKCISIITVKLGYKPPVVTFGDNGTDGR